MVACYVIDWNRIKKRVFSNLLVLLFLGTASQLRLLLVSWKLTRHMPCPLRLRRDIIRDFGGLQNAFLKRALVVCRKRQCKVTASTSLKITLFIIKTHQNPSKPIEIFVVKPVLCSSSKWSFSNVSYLRPRWANPVNIWLYFHDFCIRVMFFPQTHPAVCCNLEYLYASRFRSDGILIRLFVSFLRKSWPLMRTENLVQTT